MHWFKAHLLVGCGCKGGLVTMCESGSLEIVIDHSLLMGGSNTRLPTQKQLLGSDRFWAAVVTFLSVAVYSGVILRILLSTCSANLIEWRSVLFSGILRPTR